MSTPSFGRLAQAPHALLFRLLTEPQTEAGRRSVLPHLLRIDAAHVVMLAERRLLPASKARALLRVNRSLERSRLAGVDVLGRPAVHRGLYLLYEGLYVQRLGAHTGGAAHLARSRNDINACVTRLRLRSETLALLEALLALADALLSAARAHAGTVMAAFTHLQPAQPSTLGHYLTGVLSELLRGTSALDQAWDTLNRCPLGAAAGLGTSLPIAPQRVAELLGFDGPCLNSADAVASRDQALHVLSAAARTGLTLTRLATDMQTWGSAAYGFLDWPDELVSSSSIMPQKRNAYVWENVRGDAVQPAGALAACLIGLKNVPFANSIEGGSEALTALWPALSAATRACTLTRLMLAGLRVREQRLQAFLQGAETTMTAVADLLVVGHGLSFRHAHEAVAAWLLRHPGGAADDPARASLVRELRARGGRPGHLSAASLRRALDPAACVRVARHGGGPAPASVRAQLSTLERTLSRLRRQARGRAARLEESDAQLFEAVRRVVRPRARGSALEHRDAAPVRVGAPRKGAAT